MRKSDKDNHGSQDERRHDENDSKHPVHVRKKNIKSSEKFKAEMDNEMRKGKNKP